MESNVFLIIKLSEYYELEINGNFTYRTDKKDDFLNFLASVASKYGGENIVWTLLSFKDSYALNSSKPIDKSLELLSIVDSKKNKKERVFKTWYVNKEFVEAMTKKISFDRRKTEILPYSFFLDQKNKETTLFIGSTYLLILYYEDQILKVVKKRSFEYNKIELERGLNEMSYLKEEDINYIDKIIFMINCMIRELPELKSLKIKFSSVNFVPLFKYMISHLDVECFE